MRNATRREKGCHRTRANPAYLSLCSRTLRVSAPPPQPSAPAPTAAHLPAQYAHFRSVRRARLQARPASIAARSACEMPSKSNSGGHEPWRQTRHRALRAQMRHSRPNAPFAPSRAIFSPVKTRRVPAARDHALGAWRPTHTAKLHFQRNGKGLLHLPAPRAALARLWVMERPREAPWPRAKSRPV